MRILSFFFMFCTLYYLDFFDFVDIAGNVKRLPHHDLCVGAVDVQIRKERQTQELGTYGLRVP